MSNESINPIDTVLNKRGDTKSIPAWRLIYERLEEIEIAITRGKQHSEFAMALGVSASAYTRAKNKAYEYQKVEGQFNKSERPSTLAANAHPTVSKVVSSAANEMRSERDIPPLPKGLDAGEQKENKAWRELRHGNE